MNNAKAQAPAPKVNTGHRGEHPIPKVNKAPTIGAALGSVGKAPAPKAQGKLPGVPEKDALPENFKTTDALKEAAKLYVHDKVNKTAGGHVSVDSGDATADALRGMPIDQVYTRASLVLGVPVADLVAKYEHLNPGMQRMNLGNRVRAAMKASALASA